MTEDDGLPRRRRATYTSICFYRDCESRQRSAIPVRQRSRSQSKPARIRRAHPSSTAQVKVGSMKGDPPTSGAGRYGCCTCTKCNRSRRPSRTHRMRKVRALPHSLLWRRDCRQIRARLCRVAFQRTVTKLTNEGAALLWCAGTQCSTISPSLRWLQTVSSSQICFRHFWHWNS